MTTLHGATLVDGTGRDPVVGATVVIAGERVDRVDPSTATRRAGERVDLGGLTLLPGLIDAHSHMGILQALGQSPWSPAMLAAHLFLNAELCLAAGFTTVREVAGADGALREVIDAGLVDGPRLFPSGPMLCQSGGHGEHRDPWIDHHHHRHGIPGLTVATEVCDGPDEVRRAARDAFRRGATQLKVCVSGGVVSFGDDLEHTQFTVAELAAAVEEARSRDTYVTAHAHNSEGIRNGLEAGLECFEHGTYLDDDTAALMASRGAALVPTLAVAYLLREHAEEWGVPAEVLPKVDPVLDAMKASIKVAHANGVAIGSGSDILGPRQNRRGLELALKAEVLDPMAAIVSATATNAAIMRFDHEVGTVEPGKLADLVAVDGDPLADPWIFDDPDRVVVVVKGGRIVKDLR